MQLILSAQARDDAKDFIAWLKPLNAKSAIQARNDLGKAFDLIAKYPMANRAARTENERIKSLPKWHKIIIYKVESKRVVVLSIRDTRREPIL